MQCVYMHIYVYGCVHMYTYVYISIGIYIFYLNSFIHGACGHLLCVQDVAVCILYLESHLPYKEVFIIFILCNKIEA